ncbi:MAG: short-chain dehydrogenase [Cyclobacteriaceae bacterium]|nr:MAG: short-chain dehydrogenase [Cyclobacteriaceae bacterium]
MEPKVILVTGANKGIGYEVVRQLCALGHQVLLSARSEAKGTEAVARLKAEGIHARFLQMDVAREEQVRAAAQEVAGQFGRLDVLINNAAVLLHDDKHVSEDQATVFEKTWRTNVTGPLLTVKYFLPLMPPGSRIINTSSGGGSMTDPVGGWSPAYCISKSALNALTRHLAFELANRQITVNAYCPGWVRTDMGGRAAPRSVQQGADTAVWLATARVQETGKFFRDRRIISW